MLTATAFVSYLACNVASLEANLGGVWGLLVYSILLFWNGKMFVNPLRSLEDDKPLKEPNKIAADDKVCDFFNDVWEK